MDFLLEIVVQFVLEVLFEGLGELVVDVGHELAGRTWGRWVLLAVAGFGFGCFWGVHLSGQAHEPRLLWVSTALGGVALLRLLLPFPAEHPQGLRDYVLAPPWHWQRARVVGFALLNAGLVAGILLTFTSSGHA